MIVIGIDPHMKSHAAVALDAASGRSLGATSVGSDAAGCEALIAWARRLGDERLFALEDCRHVSGRLERGLLPRRERLVRVPPKLMAKARSSARTYGKSDPIDAECVARAALREPHLPEARLAGPERDVRLLADHRDDLIGERKRAQLRLRWHLHDLGLDLQLPPRALDRYVWLARVEASLHALPAGTRPRIALELVRRCRELTVEVRALEREITALMHVLAPELLALPGCSALSAAQLVGQVAGAARFRSEAAFAMHTGTAPLAVSSGKSQRHRLNRRGNRRLNSVIHMIAVTQVRMHPPAIAYVARKRAEGLSTREALRCLKRHIARTVFRTMRRAELAGWRYAVDIGARAGRQEVCRKPAGQPRLLTRGALGVVQVRTEEGVVRSSKRFAVALVLGLLCAFAVGVLSAPASASSWQDKVKAAQIREHVHTLQVGIQS